MIMFVAVLTLAVSAPAADVVGPSDYKAPTPDQERTLTLDAARFRKSVAVAQHELNVKYLAAVAAARAAARAQAAAQAERESDSNDVVARVAPPHSSSGACGGTLPSCAIMECESGGSLTARNGSSSASGKWQIIDSTWGNYGGYDSAADAPEHVQDAKARELWAGGAGRSQWEC